MARYRTGPVRRHDGIRDASAAVGYKRGTSLFLVASDEDKERTFLRLYDATQDGGPVREFEVPSDFLAVDQDHPEVDLEGAACLGSRIYWIGSHSRNKEGKYRSSRHRLFATEMKKGVPVPVGRAYKTLVQDLGLDIDQRRPPKEGGLSIEGLCATREPGELLIGFRSPLNQGKAILIPLRNAEEVIDPGVEPEFGTPILLDLAGLGIRSIDYWSERDTHLIIAGPASKSTEGFRLYSWSGSNLTDLEFEFSLDEAAPEALLIDGASETVYMLFDEGNRQSEGNYFRSMAIYGL
jgi:hypothetical protein